ncbi:MAG: D-alanine--D-alanine ligase [Lachnospiraceae bacterium]|nr:D-alanine--D-alanine ligase [Lachnospiraceae bacterium]
MNKKNIAVIFGGQSSEHEVSCLSAVTIIKNIDKEKYDILLIGITKDGRWLKIDDVEQIKDGTWVNSSATAVISPDAKQHGAIVIEDGRTSVVYLDVVFPVLHGLYGEDGTVQGIFELAGIPYVGCGVLASAVSMDKAYTKIIVDGIGVRQADYVLVHTSELEDIDAVVKAIEAKLSYPVFVKPCNAGSSRGVSKAKNADMLKKGLKIAAEHDRKILVEETITGREIECAVLGGSEVKASGVGEILAAQDCAFYDYEAKYINENSHTIADPELDGNVVEEIRRDAVEIFKAVDGFGLSRVDFFVTNDNEVIFNEINTLPGFTSISMYPVLWEKRGVPTEQLVEKLIQLAYTRKA